MIWGTVTKPTPNYGYAAEPLTDEEKARILELRAENRTQAEIGDAIGRCQTTVSKFLRARGQRSRAFTHRNNHTA